MTAGDRIPILYLAPWVDYGGTDKGTIDWFRWLDRDRYAPSLATTQPSANRRLTEVLPYAEEVWPLPDLMSGGEMPLAVLDLVHTRGVRVVHVMNSRIGYDLLPDLGCVSRPPKVVVQLHVEEQDRSGYVRYVTTRYGNLVDAFSVTSEHLADAVHGYGIPRDKIRVIHTGVDADAEFAPARTKHVAGLAGDRVHILYPGRLVAQKDPLLMVDVAAGLRDCGLHFQIHAVGEGPLEQAVLSRAAELGLADHIAIHPPTARLQPWYAGCDVLLMTSVFEGVPYVVYEAMAMELPVVAPALPGNVELLGEAAAGLIDPRDDADRYVAALEPLIRDRNVREELGRKGRARVREHFSLQRMAADHARLYDDLITPETSVTDPVAGNGASRTLAERRPPLRFRERRLFGTPLVSVIVPCFNQGRVLPECLDSVRAQTHPSVEVIVVDDGSTDSETIEVMNELESDHELTVIRLAENGGPSRARNAAIERCRGRYVLPVDSDNILFPDAIERLVEQIKTAGEEVGFIYPNLRYFGNREDHFEAPPWDLYALLQGNICDVCSMFDRAVFDAGERFDESIRLGHEDWEFVLRLGARGVRGEPAHEDTVRYRKWGFNRSDAVEYAPTVFGKLVRELSPLSEQERELKACWSPALSMVALTPLDPRSEAGERLAQRLATQTCIDLELIARFEGEWGRPGPAPPVRRIHPELARSPGAALAHARELARGNLIAFTTGTGSPLLADRAFVEKLLRLFESVGERGSPSFDALVLADAGDDRRVPLSLIDEGWGDAALPHTVIWPGEVEERVPGGVAVDGERPIESLAKACAAMRLRTQWRHLSADPGRRMSGEGQPPVRLPSAARLNETDRRVQEKRRARRPLIPRLPPDTVPRLVYAPTWVPPQSSNLCRHREIGGERRIVTTDRRPPSGYEIEFDLGCVRAFSLEGTARLVATAEGGYAVLPRGDWDAAPPGARHLGYVELAAFPLLEPLLLARHRPTDQQVLVSGEWDAMMPEVEPIETLGFIDAYPVNPRFAPDAEAYFGLTGLTKSVDRASRRHRYAVGAPAQGELVGELGALFDVPQTPAVRAWLVDGRVVTEEHRFRVGRPGPLVAARWTLAPLRWRGFSEPLPKARAAVRRSLDAVGEVTSRRPQLSDGPEGQTAGWLLREPLEDTLPLYAAYHPVSGDQLLSRDPYEPVAMGYGEPVLLGHLRARAPVTGSLEQRLVAVPWASRFGLRGLRT